MPRKPLRLSAAPRRGKCPADLPRGFTIGEGSADTAARRSGGPPETPAGAPVALVTLQVYGRQPVNDPAATLSDIQDDRGVVVSDANAVAE